MRPRVLFTTLGHIESDFYGRVGAELERRGHAVGHVTFSRHAARSLRAAGATAWCLPDVMKALSATDAAAEALRMTAAYDVPTFRDIYNTDFVCEGQDEAWCVARTVSHLRAMEQIFDEFAPTAVVPEVGNETIRTAAHLVGMRRDVPVLFLLNTIFPNPLRLSVDELQQPIVGRDDLRPLTAAERSELRDFAEAFLRRDEPIRDYRDLAVTGRRFRLLAHHAIVKARWDRDNPYRRPVDKVVDGLKGKLRARAVRPLYERRPRDRPFLYFPLHIPDDYKLKRLIPHRADQRGIVELVARALPHGYDLVVKEHPNSIGRNPISDLFAMRRLPNVRLAEPYESSNELIGRSEGVVVISSTVGMEALLQHKPVMTLGHPYYAGLGVTHDLHSLAEIRTELPRFVEMTADADRTDEFLHAAMRRCRPGVPVLIDRSDENASALAGSIDAACAELDRSGQARPARLRAVH